MAIDAREEIESLRLLSEVSEYLGRLPHNYMTSAMKAKVDKYLARPGAKMHEERLRVVASDRAWRERLAAGEFCSGSSSFGLTGAPVVDCLVLAGKVHLRSPAHAEVAEIGDVIRADKLALEIGREVASGMTIQIVHATDATKSYVVKQWSIGQ